MGSRESTQQTNDAACRSIRQIDEHQQAGLLIKSTGQTKMIQQTQTRMTVGHMSHICLGPCQVNLTNYSIK